MSSPISISDGIATWEPLPGDSYLVTGTTRSGKRFRFVTPNWHVAAAINVWRGTYWLQRDGRRYKIQSRFN